MMVGPQFKGILVQGTVLVGRNSIGCESGSDLDQKVTIAEVR